MDEIKTDAMQDCTETQEVANEQTDAVAEDAQPAQEPQGKKKVKLPKGLQKIVDKINSNENVRQMVVFTLFSFICGGSQLIITLILPMLLKLSSSPVLQAAFPGFYIGSVPLFQYLGKDGVGGVSDFIGFLVGSVIGQVLTFILNRKKTFKCTNNIVVSGIMYTIVAVAIIFAQTLVCGAILNALNLVAQAVSGILGLVMSFLGNKFLVMRNWGEKKKATEATEASQKTCACCTCEDCQSDDSSALDQAASDQE